MTFGPERHADALRSYMDESLAILRLTQTVTLSLAVLIAFTTSIASDERRREHATVFAFGTQLHRVRGNTVIGSMLIGTLGTLAGLGLAVPNWIIRVVARDAYPELGIPISLAPQGRSRSWQHSESSPSSSHSHPR